MGFGKKRGRKEDSTEFERRRLTASATFLAFRILGGFEQPITELKTKFDKFVNSRAGTVIEVGIANQCSHWCGPFQGFPHGEGGSRVSRKRETDEGLASPYGRGAPGRGGEGLFYPLSRLRRQLPQSGSQGETDCDRRESLERATPVCVTLRYDCHWQSLRF